MPLRLLKVVPALKALVPPEVGDPEFDVKLHDHRYALSASVVLLILIAVMSYGAAFMPWSPLKLALAEDFLTAEDRIEELKNELHTRIARVESTVDRVERTVVESSLRARFDQLQSEVRTIEDALFNVQRAIQQRADEGRPVDKIYAERAEQLESDLDRTTSRLQAFREEHAVLIRRWALRGEL